MRILAVDPGNEQSAWLIYEQRKIIMFAKEPNAELLRRLRAREFFHCDRFVVEMVASYGMAVGKEVFETCVLIGRLLELWKAHGKDEGEYMYRRNVKLALCGTARANDANIRTDLVDRWGGKDAAIGTKKAPGPLYGITKDVWSALAIAKTYALEHGGEGEMRSRIAENVGGAV